MKFEKITTENISLLRKYYKECDYQLCEYSVGTKIMWKDYLNPEIAEAAGCLVVKNQIKDHTTFDYPVAGENGDVDKALTEIELYCRDHGIYPALSVIPEDRLGKIVYRYPKMEIDNERSWRDYLYYSADLAGFEGRKYSGQRNHINKFKKNTPDAYFRELTEKDLPLIEIFWDDFEKEFTKTSEMALNELKNAKNISKMIGESCFCAGGVFDKEKLIAFSIGEKCGQTLIIHIEKALYSYTGVYPFIVQQFARHFGGECTYINREDDARDKGLRTSKMQYLPCKLGTKARLLVRTELDYLKEEPSISTERLELTPFADADKAKYNKLCLDDERNRWWGYDYRKDLKGELIEDYFLDVVREDVKAKRAVSFAVRLDGTFIGEVILYNFDFRGGAELGCRISPEYAGNGYGREAFSAVAEWTIYSLGMEKVVAKCYHENEASRKMLASCMREIGHDETFKYFEKKV